MSSKSARLKQRSDRQKKAAVRQRGILHKLIYFLLTIVVFIILPSVVAYQFLLPEYLLEADSAQRILITASDPNSSQNRLLVITKQQDEVDFFWIDGTQKITLPGDYGEYEARALAPLMIIEDKGDILRPILSYSLGFLINEVVILDNWLMDDSKLIDIETTTKHQQRHQLSQLFLRKATKSWREPATAKELITLHYLMRQTKVFENDSPPNLVISTQEARDQVTQSDLIEPAEAAECPVAVINTTTISGLANSVGSLVEESGGLVVKIEHNQQNLEKSKLLIALELKECDQIVALSQSLLPDSPDVEYLDENAIMSDYRAKIVIFLGTNLSDYSL